MQHQDDRQPDALVCEESSRADPSKRGCVSGRGVKLARGHDDRHSPPAEAERNTGRIRFAGRHLDAWFISFGDEPRWVLVHALVVEHSTAR